VDRGEGLPGPVEDEEQLLVVDVVEGRDGGQLGVHGGRDVAGQGGERGPQPPDGPGRPEPAQRRPRVQA
jgi:hypothetical protein